MCAGGGASARETNLRPEHAITSFDTLQRQSTRAARTRGRRSCASDGNAFDHATLGPQDEINTVSRFKCIEDRPCCAVDELSRDRVRDILLAPDEDGIKRGRGIDQIPISQKSNTLTDRYAHDTIDTLPDVFNALAVAVHKAVEVQDFGVFGQDDPTSLPIWHIRVFVNADGPAIRIRTACNPAIDNQIFGERPTNN